MLKILVAGRAAVHLIAPLTVINRSHPPPHPTHRVSTSPVSQCQAARVSLNSLHTRLDASVERSSVWNSSVALRCASRDRGSWPSTT